MSVTQTLSRSFAVFALTAMAAQSGFAATASHKAKAKSTVKSEVKLATAAADGIETASVEADETSVDSRRPAGGNGPSTLNSNSTVPAATSSASLPKEIQAASPRRVFGEFYTEAYTAYDDISNGKGSPRLDSFAGVKYDLGNARSFSVRQNFDYTGLSSTRTNAFHVQDIALNYADGKLATFATDGALTLIAREYLPTGENSRFLTGNVGAERLYLIAAKSFGKLDLDVLTMGQLSNNTKDSYKDATGAEKQNRWGYITYEGDAFYNISPKFAAGVSVYVEHLFFRELSGNPDSTADMGLEPVIQFAPVKGLTFQAAIINEVEIAHPAQAVGFARADEVKAYFNMNASL
jgi:hypothetical protein